MIYIAIGGAGNKLLNQLITTGEVKRGLFAVDTDAQALMKSLSPKRIQIGEKETRGLGTSGDANIGRHAAENAREQLAAVFDNAESVCILTGIHGGTGLGATPVIASYAKAAGACTNLLVMIDGTEPTEKENSVLEKWRTFADELHVWKHKNREPEEKER